MVKRSTSTWIRAGVVHLVFGVALEEVFTQCFGEKYWGELSRDGDSQWKLSSPKKPQKSLEKTGNNGWKFMMIWEMFFR